MKVYVLTVELPDWSRTVSIHQTDEEANAIMADLVDGWWDVDMLPDKKPDDPGQMIAAYCERTGCSWYLDECEVDWLEHREARS